MDNIYLDDNTYDDYEPTDEEWEEIEKSIEDEFEKITEITEQDKKEDKIELKTFKDWLKRNGISWDRENVPNAKKERK